METVSYFTIQFITFLTITFKMPFVWVDHRYVTSLAGSSWFTIKTLSMLLSL